MDTNNTNTLKKMNFIYIYLILMTFISKFLDFLIKILIILLYFIIIKTITILIIIRITCLNDNNDLFICKY